MRPPITLDYRGDIEIFDDLREAEQFLEPDDIQQNNVSAYDADGRILLGRVVRHGFLSRRVVLEPAEPATINAEALRGVLMNFIQRTTTSGSELAFGSLDELLTIAREILRH